MTKKLENDEKTNGNVEQVIEKALADVYERVTPEPLDRKIFGQVLKLLSRGNPVRPDEIATNFQTTPENVIATIRGFGTEFNNEGNILGLLLTLARTPHIYRSNGHSLYTWCAADALFVPVILGQTADVESHDPVTGEKVSLRVTPDMLENVNPKNTVVSFVKYIDPTNVRCTVCNKINFFASPQSASKWIEKYSDMMLYPVSELYEALKQVFLKKYSDIVAGSKQERVCC